MTARSSKIGSAYRRTDPMSCGDTACNGSMNVITNCLRQWRTNVDLTCGHCYVPIHIPKASPNVFVNCEEFCRVGDAHACHCCPGAGCHCGVAAAGSPNVCANVGESRDAIIGPDAAQNYPAAAVQANISGSNAHTGPFPDAVDEREQIKSDYPGTPTSEPEPEEGNPPPNNPTELSECLEQFLADGNAGLYDESGTFGTGAGSNPRILNMWKDIGLGGYKGGNLSDQDPWCAVFMNHALKKCGYKYRKSARAFAIDENPSAWNATQVNQADAQPGDIVVWNYSHVNFVRKNENGRMTFIGGNQRDRGSGASNSPSNGTVSESWPTGFPPGRGGIKAIYRPSKC